MDLLPILPPSTSLFICNQFLNDTHILYHFEPCSDLFSYYYFCFVLRSDPAIFDSIMFSSSINILKSYSSSDELLSSNFFSNALCSITNLSFSSNVAVNSFSVSYAHLNIPSTFRKNSSSINDASIWSR